MNTTVCPTITAETSEAYEAQMNKVVPFAGRIHLDVADGQLAPRTLLPLDKLWWPGNRLVDIHVMYKRPFVHTDLFIAQHPNLIIVHAEAEGDFTAFAEKMHKHGVQVGVALLPPTQVSMIVPALPLIDHVLIFSGNLGYQGGSQADFTLLTKARQLRALKSSVEIGWDGGVNASNAHRLAFGGVDVLNVGGFIQHAPNSQLAYKQLVAVSQ